MSKRNAQNSSQQQKADMSAASHMVEEEVSFSFQVVEDALRMINVHSNRLAIAEQVAKLVTLAEDM